MADWTHRMLGLAQHIAQWSPDPSTKVGCVITGPNNEIRSTGYNGLPRGIPNRPDLLMRPGKYLWIAHAEINAITNAARNGVSLEGCTLYCTLAPCSDCAKAIIQAGIVQVITPDYDPKILSEAMRPTILTAETMLEDAGVCQVKWSNDND